MRDGDGRDLRLVGPGNIPRHFIASAHSNSVGSRARIMGLQICVDDAFGNGDDYAIVGTSYVEYRACND